MQPQMQALSVQSYNNDSPPFTGSTHLSNDAVPAFDLDADEDQFVLPNGSSRLAGVVRNGAALRPIPVLSRAASHIISPAITPGRSPATTPVPGNQDKPSPPMVAESLRPMSEYTDLDRPSRIASPINLTHDISQYNFPRHRLATQMQDESKIPLVIVACGSFSPPTYLHLRMFEMAKDAVDAEEKFEILGGYYSPVSDTYKKSGLAPAIHRVRMCELAVDQTSSWLMVDPWEASQPDYTRTALVLEHFDEHLNGAGGIALQDGTKKRIKIVLLAGGDLIESFGEPGVWSEPDLHIILGRFGCLIIERTGADVWAFLLSHDILYQHRKNVIVVKQLIYNDISSTKVRLFVKRGMSIKFLLPNSVIQYIYDHKLYANPKVTEPPLKSV